MRLAYSSLLLVFYQRRVFAYTQELLEKLDDNTADCNCVAVDSRVSDQWCLDDCMCDWCPGCGNDYCAGYCACEGDKPTPDPNGPTPPPTTPATTTTPYDPDSGKVLCDSPFMYNVIYIDFGINWNDITVNIQEAVDNCFNILMVSFWVHGSFADAAQVWTYMTNAQRQAALDVAHSHGAQILLAGGGATDGIENYVKNGEGDWYGRTLAEDAVKYMFDGVDFDVELQPGNNGPFQDGTMQQFILDASNAAREVFTAAGKPDALITHAPQAPYLGVWTGEATMGYTGILKEPDCPIDFVNIQFYNQCPTCYSTYESLMIDGDAEGGDHSLTGESAVAQMIANGVPPEKIVIGKPIGPTGYANNGYVSPKDLHDWGCQAKYDSETFKNWHTGFMTWRYAMGDKDLSFGLYIKEHCEQDPDYTTQPPTTLPPPETLQEAAQGLGLDIGTTLEEADIAGLNNKEEFFEIAENNFNAVTPEEACRPINVITGDSFDNYEFDLSECETAQHAANDRGQIFRGSFLLSFYDADWPTFVSESTDAAALENFLNDFVSTMVTEISGAFFRDVYAWDVAKDLIVDDNYGFYRDSFWQQVPEVQCKVFQFAKAARPDTFLMLQDHAHASATKTPNNMNDFNQALKSDKVFELAKLLDGANCGIDGVGFASKLSLDYTDEDIEGIALNMQRYAEQGLRVHITEASVGCSEDTTKVCEWNSDEFDLQAEIYAKLWQTCIDQYYCTSFSVGGFSDAVLSKHEPGAGMWDADLQPKPAFYAVMESLINADRSSLSNQARLMLIEK